jgi:DnaJ-class molecular chaperone
MLSPFVILNIEDNADDETVRAAYVRALRHSPPDRDPEGFARIRGAYETIRDAEKRLAYRLFGPPPLAQVEDLLDLMPNERRHVGPTAWLNILRESQR